MAADVRKDSDSEIESCSIPVSPEGSYASSRSSTLPLPCPLPSYLIVQKQMQDIILTQREAVEDLVRNNINVLNASRDSFNTTVQSQEEKIKQLERTIEEECVPVEKYKALHVDLEENYVPRAAFESLQNQLEKEYEKHGETQAKLQEVLDKLDASLQQITTMTSQMEKDKAVFNTACDTLHEEITEANAKNRDLNTRLNEKSLLCERQQEQILQQQKQIEGLCQKQQQQEFKYRQKVTETEVEKQQEAYLQKMLSDMNKKKR